jgi:histidine triad (HIT) family protein
MADCLFCKIAKKEISSSIVYEDDKVFAFNDINPKAPTHILVIPKRHVSSVADKEAAAVVGDLFSVMKKLAEEKGVDKTGYRIIVNHGRDSGQAVPHLHFHLLGGRPLKWPPG